MCDYCKMRVFILLLVCVLVAGVPGVSKHEVIVTKGDSVTLHTGVTTDQQEDIRWFFKNTLLAEITGDLSFICTDVQCNEGNERFRDRLKLDHQTGSLTITNIRYTDSGVYHIQFNSSSDSEKIFKFIVRDISVAKQKKIAEGESVTLDAGVIKQNDMVTWYFDDTLIALATGDLSKICTDVQWKDSNDRFRDRLKLNYRFSWSLILTNMSSTDSGLYTLKINKSSFSITRSVTVTVTVPSLIPAAFATAVLVWAVCSCCTDLLSQKAQAHPKAVFSHPGYSLSTQTSSHHTTVLSALFGQYNHYRTHHQQPRNHIPCTDQPSIDLGPVSERRLSENSEYVNPEMRQTLGFLFQNGRYVKPEKVE